MKKYLMKAILTIIAVVLIVVFNIPIDWITLLVLVLIWCGDLTLSVEVTRDESDKEAV